jgi:hypothetical protein
VGGKDAGEVGSETILNISQRDICAGEVTGGLATNSKGGDAEGGGELLVVGDDVEGVRGATTERGDTREQRGAVTQLLDGGELEGVVERDLGLGTFFGASKSVDGYVLVGVVRLLGGARVVENNGRRGTRLLIVKTSFLSRGKRGERTGGREAERGRR